MFLLCQNDTPRLSSDAKKLLLSGILGMNRGNVATSSYHGDDDNHDDDDLDYDDVDERYDKEDNCSVVKAATVRIRPVREYSSDEMTITVYTGTIPQLPCHTWTMCQTNIQIKSFIHFIWQILFSKKILFVFKK